VYQDERRGVQSSGSAAEGLTDAAGLPDSYVKPIFTWINVLV
jgi:hypothetical protein